jgi:Tfp pilus assembly ATPase PilU
MQTLEVNLAALIAADTITYEEALEVSVHPKELDRALKKLRMDTSRNQMTRTALEQPLPPGSSG